MFEFTLPLDAVSRLPEAAPLHYIAHSSCPSQVPTMTAQLVFILMFMHLVDAFFPKRLTNEDITLQLTSKLTISYTER